MSSVNPSYHRPSSFSWISRFNHWITATIFLGAPGLGLVMAFAGLPRESIGALMGWHKASGVAIFAYGVWRVGRRIYKGFPPQLASAPAWQALTSRIVHIALLAAILAMPLSGILMTIAGGRTLDIWGVTLLPTLGEIAWVKTMGETLHEQAPLVIVALLIVHIGRQPSHRSMVDTISG